jgi:hypothetical protein
MKAKYSLHGSPSPSTPATSAFAPAPPGRRQASSHRQGVLRDSSQANTRFDIHKGGGLGLGKAASAAGGMYSASTAASPSASVTNSPAPATYSPMVCSGLPQSHPASVVDVERPGVGLSRNPRNLFANYQHDCNERNFFFLTAVMTTAGRISGDFLCLLRLNNNNNNNIRPVIIGGSGGQGPAEMPGAR